MTAPTDTTYNGLPNHATWRVNLEAFAAFSVAELTGTDHLADFLSLYASVPVAEMALAEMLREQVEDMIEGTTTEGMARDYAMAFLRSVDWHSIARHKIAEDMADELAELR